MAKKIETHQAVYTLDPIEQSLLDMLKGRLDDLDREKRPLLAAIAKIEAKERIAKAKAFADVMENQGHDAKGAIRWSHQGGALTVLYQGKAPGLQAGPAEVTAKEADVAIAALEVLNENAEAEEAEIEKALADAEEPAPAAAAD
jgi:hypothetical protein